ncbi:MAG TPA: protein kinase, partial [Thermoanaerobaculia bacterium]
MTEPLAEEPLRLFIHYTVEKLIGRGAMGLVYLARDARLGRHVALKTLHPRREELEDTQAEVEFFERFRREAELCGKLNHPNIVTLYEAGYEEDRVTFLAM